MSEPIPFHKYIKIIGLTGVYCAGKNHVAKILERRGLPVLDVDVFGHNAIETEKKRIVARFGGDILKTSGEIDRKLLGAKVFGRPGELAALEEIIHPRANQDTITWIKARTEKACVINAALLHRSPVFTLLDAVIIVEAPFPVRLIRAKKRDRLRWPEIIKRIKSQCKFPAQYLDKKADTYRVENFGFPGPLGRVLRNRQENRIDEILSLCGIL